MRKFTVKLLNASIFICFLATQMIIERQLIANESTERVFTDIYKSKYWAGDSSKIGHSGIGSQQGTTETYRNFLQDFFKDYDIHSVVDVGCGDWKFSRTMDWTGIDYVGYDIVKPLIKSNRRKYGRHNIHFVHGNAINMTLPKADLLICKDVLQHLPNEDVQKFIPQLKNFKYCLITNDVDPVTLTSDNPTIIAGEYRLLDLSQPPFSLEGIKILNYWAGVSHKMVFFIAN